VVVMINRLVLGASSKLYLPACRGRVAGSPGAVCRGRVAGSPGSNDS
jgi:hypothetical protein